MIMKVVGMSVMEINLVLMMIKVLMTEIRTLLELIKET